MIEQWFNNLAQGYLQVLKASADTTHTSEEAKSNASVTWSTAVDKENVLPARSELIEMTLSSIPPSLVLPCRGCLDSHREDSMKLSNLAAIV